MPVPVPPFKVAVKVVLVVPAQKLLLLAETVIVGSGTTVKVKTGVVCIPQEVLLYITLNKRVALRVATMLVVLLVVPLTLYHVTPPSVLCCQV